MPTTTRILQLAPVCCMLAANYKDKKSLSGQPSPTSVNQSHLIYIFYKILNRIYTEDPTYPGLQAVANYLYELEQKFAFKAAYIVDGGGGGQIAPPSTSPSVDRIDFIVSSGSLIPTGGSSLTILEFIGYNLEFDRNGVPQSALTTEISYFTWNKLTGDFSCSPALEAGEVIALIPV